MVHKRQSYRYLLLCLRKQTHNNPLDARGPVHEHDGALRCEGPQAKAGANLCLPVVPVRIAGARPGYVGSGRRAYGTRKQPCHRVPNRAANKEGSHEKSLVRDNQQRADRWPPGDATAHVHRYHFSHQIGPVFLQHVGVNAGRREGGGGAEGLEPKHVRREGPTHNE